MTTTGTISEPPLAAEAQHGAPEAPMVGGTVAVRTASHPGQGLPGAATSACPEDGDGRWHFNSSKAYSGLGQKRGSLGTSRSVLYYAMRTRLHCHDGIISGRLFGRIASRHLLWRSGSSLSSAMRVPLH